MYQDNIGNVSLKLVLDKRSKNKKGLYPIKTQVIYLRTSKYFSTGITITEEEWDKLPNTRIPELVDKRNRSKEFFDFAVKNVREMYTKGEFSFDMLNVLMGKEVGETLNAALKIKIRTLNEAGQIGTKWYYEDVLSTVERFAKTEVPLKSITVDWLNRFEAFLLKLGFSYATIGMRMRGIRTMMNVGKKNGLIKESNYPFGKDKYEIKTTSSKKKGLTLEQIAKIANFKCDNDEIMYCRDLWLFIYLCNGLNLVDLAKLKYQNIIANEIAFIRTKTIRTTRDISEIRVTMLPEMQAIIDRWGNEPLPENYIFQTIDEEKDKERYMKKLALFNKKLNTNMKFIGSVLGIGKITTYTARHSFATLISAGLN